MSVLNDLQETTLVPFSDERDHEPSGLVRCSYCDETLSALSLLQYDFKGYVTERIEAPHLDFYAISRKMMSRFEDAWLSVKVVDILCGNCSCSCDDCGDIVVTDTTYLTARSETICEGCYENYSNCDYCEDIYHSDDVYPIDGGNNYYCEECRDHHAYACDNCDEYHRDHYHCEAGSVESNLINSYSYKPYPIFHGIKGGQKLFFGLELEIEDTSGNYLEGAQLVSDRLGDFVYLKEDSSLERGFEIVTHPFDFEYYKSSFNFNFLDDLRALGFRSWDSKTCGLHIHISKSGFISGGHIWRFSNLILNNLPQWVKIAGRNSERWASFDKGANKIAGVLKGKDFPERYVAVNMSNDKTIEVRIFRGSLNERRVRAAIESIHAAVTYTKDLSVRDVADHALTFERFAQWVEGVGEYANLCDLLIAKNIIHNSAAAEKVGQ
jgi:hypothetical protein